MGGPVISAAMLRSGRTKWRERDVAHLPREGGDVGQAKLFEREQLVDRCDALDAAHAVAQALARDRTWTRRHLEAQQVGHRLQIVLDAVMHLLHESGQRIGSPGLLTQPHILKRKADLRAYGPQQRHLGLA